MNRNAIRTVIALATLSILGIAVIQVFWMQKAFDLREREFSDRVNIALRSVAQEVMMMSGDSTEVAPVHQLSSNYFVVSVNDTLHPYLLESLLSNEFDSRNLRTNFEYTIYDCFSDSLVFGNLVTFSDKKTKEEKPKNLPGLKNEGHYFGVFFPDKDGYIQAQMGIWMFSSGILLLVIFFFAYTLWVILKQKRLSEIRNDFINNMTHEFKTPVSTISASSEILISGDIESHPDKRKRYYQMIQDESNRLKLQVEKVLQVAQFDKGEIELNLSQINIHELIISSTNSLQLLIDQKKGSVTTKLAASNPIIEGDHLHISNIIYNLLDNALKYCTELPEIHVETRDARNGIEIDFSDNGIGIPPKLQKDVFTKFFRVPTGDVHNVKGFGLGLYYVSTMVKAHHGSIKLSSESNQGSRFTIFIPLKQ
jgi:two-component system phosphate regulon sensor histidine kinase PhoR